MFNSACIKDPRVHALQHHVIITLPISNIPGSCMHLPVGSGQYMHVHVLPAWSEMLHLISEWKVAWQPNFAYRHVWAFV